MSNIDVEFSKMAEEAIKKVNERMKAEVPKVAKPKYPHYEPLYKMLINGGWKGNALKNRYDGLVLGGE